MFSPSLFVSAIFHRQEKNTTPIVAHVVSFAILNRSLTTTEHERPRKLQMIIQFLRGERPVDGQE